MITHQMQLIKTLDDGREEWYCPTCGRAFLLSWPPDYQKTILEEGDPIAEHSGGKGGVVLQPPQVANPLDGWIDDIEAGLADRPGDDGG
jgi:hypothetical protein